MTPEPARDAHVGNVVSAAGVRITDIGGEKFEEAHARLVAGGINQRRKRIAGKEDEFVHGLWRYIETCGARCASSRLRIERGRS